MVQPTAYPPIPQLLPAPVTGLIAVVATQGSQETLPGQPEPVIMGIGTRVLKDDYFSLVDQPSQEHKETVSGLDVAVSVLKISTGIDLGQPFAISGSRVSTEGRTYFLQTPSLTGPATENWLKRSPLEPRVVGLTVVQGTQITAQVGTTDDPIVLKGVYPNVSASRG